MKKLILGFAMLLFGQISFGQAVSDNAVIPVSVTLNSILRLTVTSGGNIQFIVTTVAHYTGGIANANRYDTNFRVSSSRNFTVTMTTDHATNFTGMETGNVTSFLNNNIGYLVTGAAGIQSAALRGLDASYAIVDAGVAGGNQDYTINWELGTRGGGGMNAQTLLAQSIPADVYVQNIFLTLAPRP